MQKLLLRLVRYILVRSLFTVLIDIFFSSVPAPSHQAALTPILSTVSTANMQANLNQLTAFNNRYYKSTTGTQASTWILNAVKSVSIY